MESIKKTISLEPGKSRYPGLLPFITTEGTIEQDNNYGQFVCDINFSNIPDGDYYQDLKDFGVLSYRAAINRYHWIERFFNKCTFYRIVTKNGIKTLSKIEDFTPEEYYIANYINDDLSKIIFQLGYDVNTVTFVESIDDISSVSDSTVIGVMENTEETEYTYEKFQNLGGLLFYKFMERAIGLIAVPESISGTNVPNYIFLSKASDNLKQLLFERDHPKCNVSKYKDMGGDQMKNFLIALCGSYKYTEYAYFASLAQSASTSFNIPLLITQKYDDMGIMDLIAQDWVSGQEYYSGDTIFYNENTFVCIEDVTYEDYIGEILTPEEDTTHWYELTADNTYSEEFPHDTIYYSGESLLRDLRVYKKCYDDNGNELFGNIQYDSSSKPLSQLSFPYVQGTVDSSSVYSVETEDGEDFYGNVLYSVEKDTENEEYTFKYVIGGLLEESSAGTYSYVESGNTGIRYEETYPYETRTFETSIDGEIKDYTEDYIDFDKYGAQVDSIGQNIIFSKMSNTENNLFERSKYTGENMTYSCIYRNEKDFGLSEKKIWNISVNVDRSYNAAYQKHFQLMEVNTFEDIENYRNNDFALDTE